MGITAGFLVWVLAAALAAVLPAQTGTLVGTMKDDGGGLLPGVTVTVRSEGRTRTAVTNSDGEYRIDQLIAGQYRIEVVFAGFTSLVVENIDIGANRTTTWDATLKIAGRRAFDPFADFQARVKQFVGAGAIDCGQHRIVKMLGVATREELQQFLACGLEAAGQKKPFWTSQQHQGIDSTVFSGLASRGDGAVQWMQYDSDPSGGSGAVPNFRIQPCAKPSVHQEGQQWPRFRCS